MPTYAYRCTACDHAFEAQQSFSDASLTVCPECEGRLRKVFSSVGVVFKGSGFYRTDARSGGSPSTSSVPSGSSSSSSGSDSAGSASTGSSSTGSSSAGSAGSSSAGSATSTAAPTAAAS